MNALPQTTRILFDLSFLRPPVVRSHTAELSSHTSSVLMLLLTAAQPRQLFSSIPNQLSLPSTNRSAGPKSSPLSRYIPPVVNDLHKFSVSIWGFITAPTPMTKSTKFIVAENAILVPIPDQPRVVALIQYIDREEPRFGRRRPAKRGRPASNERVLVDNSTPINAEIIEVSDDEGENVGPQQGRFPAFVNFKSPQSRLPFFAHIISAVLKEGKQTGRNWKNGVSGGSWNG
ncbi:hypothetical protein QBC36DRAFT_312504 [Triangularia setosa]|uniref:Uncharacterized protein n=1 Tax=Triangularia setosa TaxID=2587417 RepID=A0AAN6W472_9PEZI|nr:hypothetical protein QBC36DRAFT_312504 [Podospora setosa]